ncbi:hypothetical protein [Marinobacter arenosus]|uniref:hypothetical protein n=1 Tax=Marinobacter arenosus TaxID=2856822 RepID=UPI001C4A8D86|nr:hypothetical protein [Marinobacter arenosus]MBW0149034.1 hypothetical protein [Marinobacter arenosus]
MSIFYKASDKELREERNKIFLENGLPALERQGFCKSPFSTSWFGKDDHGGYSYELCRLTKDSELQIIEVNICLRDRWIQEHLNIFSLVPHCEAIENLSGVDGLQFHLPPNSQTKARLEPPRGLIFAGMPRHKVGRYLTRRGLSKRLSKLENLVETDLGDIQNYVKRWHSSNVIQTTQWNGHAV